MVLIINRRKRDAAEVSEIFHYMGILSYGTTPPLALSEISSFYRAVIIMEPDTLPDPCDYVKKLRSYASMVPIFALCNDVKSLKHPKMFDGVFKFAIYSSILASKIAEYSRSRKLSYIGDYRLAGINATCDLKFTTYFEKPIIFTKTEVMIARALIRAYPMPLNAAKLIKYAFRPSRSPELSSVRSYICALNKKFRDATGSNMITSIQGEGYVMITPEIVRDRNLVI